MRHSGHTEILAELTGTKAYAMLLMGRELRVIHVTTHVALRRVPELVTRERVLMTIRLGHEAMRRLGLAAPRLAVCGLNPHAGEGGHLGREEIDIIEPTLAHLRAEGLDLIGPLPADTLFTPKHLEHCDAVLAMYHDQGLPVLKHAAFGNAVNVTLGLPIVRTSVDHGTALDRAGRGEVDAGSLREALALAFELAARRA